ncbi:MAG: molybdate ABC transporter substrate-binding protein [Pseudomonadota bacterium]
MTLYTAAASLFVLFSAQPVLASSGKSDEATLAVASNFRQTAQTLANEFEALTERRVILVSAASGSLYAQIHAGAPFDALLSADAVTPTALGAAAPTIKSTQFTYAIGTLVFWSRCRTDLTHSDALVNLDDRSVAIANPAIAPYGKAAVSVLERLAPRSIAKVVQASNVVQTYALISSCAVDGGFVGLAQVKGGESSGHYWTVPQSWYSPIRQDAILTPQGEANDTARCFLLFLQTPTARSIIGAAGYQLPESKRTETVHASDWTGCLSQ